jgi:ribosomal-protein-alanine N-acetyltransferase
MNLDNLFAVMPKIPFSIIKMTLDDLPEVLAIEKAAYSAPWSEEVYRQELRNERAYFDLVKYRGKIVGYSGMWHLASEVHIGTLATHPLARRKGIGELLLLNIIKRARELASKRVTLEVRPSNQAARKLYTKYGFQEVGRRKGYYPDTREDAIIMATPSIASKAYQDLFQTLADKLFDRLTYFRLDEFS